MAAIELRVDIATLINAIISGDSERIIFVSRDLLQQERHADVLIGRIGMLAAPGDLTGHTTITLASAAMLARLLHARPAPLDTEVPSQTRALALFVQAMLTATPAVRAGHDAHIEYPRAFFPSELIDTGKSVNELMNEAIQKNDAELAERILRGFYGTGADYRTLQVRAYESVATTFHDGGHPLIYAVRGFQMLDAVEWGARVPIIIHWLAPHLTIKPNSTQPAWSEEVRHYTADPAHNLATIRTRLSAPKDTNALPLRQLLLSNADTTQVCQAVYDALIVNEASPRAVASVIALAAADLLQKVEAESRDLFINAAHGLLFASAARAIFKQVQDVEVLNVLFTSAAYVNALQKEITSQSGTNAQPIIPATPSSVAGGGLIAVSQLETLEAQMKMQDVRGALTTAQRYLSLSHDARALFGTIGLAAALNDTSADEGHSLQIVEAASEAFTSWPTTLATVNIEPFLHVALRAASFGERNSTVANLA
ncbi:MAG: hypothetical protein NVS2B12_03210 [Ktedonobacteraceae bacterium]